MLTHILVPLDGSSTAEGVLPHVHAFARAFDAHVTLVHVVDSTPITELSARVAPMSWHIRKSEMHAYLDSIAAHLLPQGNKVDVVLLEGRVVESIADYARSNAVDLLVVSSHGHGGCAELPVGSTAQRLLARCSLHKLIVHALPGQAPETSVLLNYQRVFVPLDGSWRAECALPVAHALASRMGARITYAHAVRKPEMARRVPLSEEETLLEETVAQRNRAEAEHYFAQLRSRVSAPVDTEIVDGVNAGLILNELAERLHPDLIVLSAHGFSGAMQLPFGSVADCFVTRSSAPVLIVRDDVQQNPASFQVAPVVTRHQETPQHA